MIIPGRTLIFTTLLFIIAFVLLWNRRLGRAIRERKTVERKIKAMGQAMADALVMMNGRGKILFWNHAAETLFGYTAEEAMDRDFHEMTAPPEVRERARTGLSHFASTGEGAVFGSTISTVAINRAGHSFPVEVSISPFQVEDEWFAVGTVRNISDRLKAEETTRESEKRFRAYFEHSQSGMSVTSPEKGWIEMNNRLQEMLGYTLEELQGTTWATLTYPEDMEEDLRYFERMLAGEIDTYGMDKRFIRKDGSILYTNMLISCLRDETKAVKLVLASFLDITERKQAEIERDKSEKQHRTIFENSPLGMIHMSPEGTIMNCNQQFVELMGSSREKLIGFNSLKQGQDMAMKSALQKALTGETAEYDGEYTSATSGKTIPLNMKFSPVNPGQNPTEVIVTLEDVTERKQSEQQMKAQLDELEQFSRLTVNREERMIELKEEINGLLEQLGKGKKYKIVE